MIAPITHIAFGDQGVAADGSVITPNGSQNGLNHEVGRYPIDSVTYPLPTTACYTVTIPEDDLSGVLISEASLVDKDGGHCAIKNMLSKGKDQGVSFEFKIEDRF